MSETKELFSHFASILPVKEMDKSIGFYTDKLGFKLNFTWNDPIDYAVLKRGEVSVHLSRIEAGQSSTDRSFLYIFVYDVEKVYEELKKKGVEITNPLNKQDYGMKDFDIVDLDGHRLSFGQNS